jgi:hypothetical protein
VGDEWAERDGGIEKSVVDTSRNAKFLAGNVGQYLVFSLFLSLKYDIRMLSHQLSDVMATCEDNIKDIKAIAKYCPEHLTLIDAIGNYRKISFDFCVSYEVRTITPVQPLNTDID